MLKNDRWCVFAALLNGKVVGTSAVSFVSKDKLDSSFDVAGIFWVAVLPERRKGGIGSAITWAAVNEAKKRGSKLAVLSASSQGKSIYEKLGFKKYFSGVRY